MLGRINKNLKTVSPDPTIRGNKCSDRDEKIGKATCADPIQMSTVQTKGCVVPISNDPSSSPGYLHILFPKGGPHPTPAPLITRTHSSSAPSARYCTRNVLTFVNTTAIAWCQDQRKKAEFWRYAIAVVFTNVRTLRVLVSTVRYGWIS